MLGARRALLRTPSAARMSKPSILTANGDRRAMRLASLGSASLALLALVTTADGCSSTTPVNTDGGPPGTDGSGGGSGSGSGGEAGVTPDAFIAATVDGASSGADHDGPGRRHGEPSVRRRGRLPLRAMRRVT